MTQLGTRLRSIVALYRLQLDDADLLRGQFGAFIQQIPLLYAILAANAMAVAIACRAIDAWVLTRAVPAGLFLVALTRGVWWWKRRGYAFSEAQMRRHMRATSLLATALACGFLLWVFLLFPHGDAYVRAHLMFFLAITLVSCVFCLMPLRSAALGVATLGIVPFTLLGLLADHGRMWVEALNFAGVVVGMVVILLRYNHSFEALIHSQRDLRQRQRETELLSEENRQIALTDALSGLPNRRALIARLDDLHPTIAKAPASVAILFADLDGFKTINDDYGHQLGDALIRHLSEALAALAPPSAMLARMGGDEFAMLITGPDAPGQARRVALDILAALALPIALGGHQLHVGASIGIGWAGGDKVDAFEVLRRADTAMYRVKAEGRSGIRFYDPSFDKDRLWRQRIEAEIRAGLAAGEFAVDYQPLISAQTNEVVAVEALLRWPGRPDGPLAPDDFIGIAETSGLINPLALFVLRQSCEALRDLAPLRLNINISPAQFRQPGFEQDMAAVLEETGFSASRLQVEITEGYLIDHPERATRAIAAFRAMGASLALDDFGAGFASIGYLRSFGFNAIKIDRSLASGLGEDPKAAMLITGMVHLAKGLDLLVTAEGVETETQEQMLRLAGCHELQGFRFGRPGPLAEVLAHSARTRRARQAAP